MDTSGTATELLEIGGDVRLLLNGDGSLPRVPTAIRRPTAGSVCACRIARASLKTSRPSLVGTARNCAYRKAGM